LFVDSPKTTNDSFGVHKKFFTKSTACEKFLPGQTHPISERTRTKRNTKNIERGRYRDSGLKAMEMVNVNA